MNDAVEDLSADAHDSVVTRRVLDDLVSRALAYRTGPEFKALLDFTLRFPHLAPYNAMLLHVQNKDITYALRATDWERKYKRRVKQGARPYVILWTMGPVAFVFDLGDTEPIDPSNDLVPPLVTNPFPAKGNPPPGAFEKLRDACSETGIAICVQDLGGNLAGDVTRYGGLDGEFFVRLNAKHTEAQQLGTLSHELAHVFCGHLGSTERGFWTDRAATDHAVREFEAEAVAYLVAARLNLDIGSVAYLSGYLTEANPLPNYSLDAVLTAAGKIEQMLGGRFRPKRRKQGQAR